jgi:hypothetical protein
MQSPSRDRLLQGVSMRLAYKETSEETNRRTHLNGRAEENEHREWDASREELD